MGVRIAEGTEVLAYTQRRVDTPNATVTAPIILRCTEAVSYTHLDVYKRQSPGSPYAA